MLKDKKNIAIIALILIWLFKKCNTCGKSSCECGTKGISVESEEIESHEHIHHEEIEEDIYKPEEMPPISGGLDTRHDINLGISSVTSGVNKEAYERRTDSEYYPDLESFVQVKR